MKSSGSNLRTMLVHNRCFDFISFCLLSSEASMTTDLLGSRTEGSTTTVWPKKPPSFLLDVISNNVCALPQLI